MDLDPRVSRFPHRVLQEVDGGGPSIDPLPVGVFRVGRGRPAGAQTR